MAYSLGVVVAVVPPDWLPGCGLCSQHSCSQMHANVTSPRHHPAQQSTFASSSSSPSTRFCLHFSVLILFVDMLLIGLLHYECTAFFTRLLTSRLPSFLFGAPLFLVALEISSVLKICWSEAVNIVQSRQYFAPANVSFLCKTISRDSRSLVRVVSLDDDGGDACSSFISVSPIKEAGTLLIRQPYTDIDTLLSWQWLALLTLVGTASVRGLIEDELRRSLALLYYYLLSVFQCEVQMNRILALPTNLLTLPPYTVVLGRGQRKELVYLPRRHQCDCSFCPAEKVAAAVGASLTDWLKFWYRSIYCVLVIHKGLLGINS